ncbi:MAG: biotin--[acetyl-CoA-carboxylase] ligase, partial [Chloroflexi bacterium]|nr:biotin--[acetyl-CoA-carboxylase] ligase [Chloroflexota bacterium]
EEIQRGLATEFVGRRIIYLQSTDSTNEVAKDEAQAGAAEGTVVIAEEQVKGKGRRGRIWLAPRGSSLLFSVIFYPRLLPEEAARLTMVASWAAAEAIAQTTGLDCRLKWPNDIQVGGKKAGGILTEAAFTEEWVEYAVVGVGINVNWDPTQIPELRDTATSLSEALGREVPRAPLLRAILAKLEEGYKLAHEDQEFYRLWARQLDSLHREVEINLVGEIVHGFAEDVDREGALLLRESDGSLRRITMGEVL